MGARIYIYREIWRRESEQTRSWQGAASRNLEPSMLQCRVCMGVHGYGASVCKYIEKEGEEEHADTVWERRCFAQPGTAYVAV